MSCEITFHPLVQRDLNEILAYYEMEASAEIADRFENEVRSALVIPDAIRSTSSSDFTDVVRLRRSLT